MKHLFFIFSFMLVAMASCYVKQAPDTTDVVEEVTVAVDSCSEVTTSPWKLDYFIDEFGEKTNEAYLRYNAYGEFSNSATTDSRLSVCIIVTKKGIRFDTYEYNSQKMKGEGSLEYRAKLPNDSIVYFHTWDDYEGFNSVNEADVKKVIELFKNYDDIRFAARTQNSYSVSTYRFSYSANANIFTNDYDNLAE